MGFRNTGLLGLHCKNFGNESILLSKMCAIRNSQQKVNCYVLSIFLKTVILARTLGCSFHTYYQIQGNLGLWLQFKVTSSSGGYEDGVLLVSANNIGVCGTMFAFWDFRRTLCSGVNCISFLSSRMKYLCVSKPYFKKPQKIEGNNVSCLFVLSQRNIFYESQAQYNEWTQNFCNSL